MENPCDEKPDDLDITSIGSLYSGPWDKKYWSCSRGKDRYPYPVGYHAVRTHAGITYRMEIHEGLKGPLFVVTSTDGASCNGQTPDIAWENFQKKSGPRVKNWHGKRFSSKIDGVELFGFRNPFVQRLLRELVANVNGMAERSLISPNICNGFSQLYHEIHHQDSCRYPDLVPFLGKQQSTGKRSRKQKSSTKGISKQARIKRVCSQDLPHDAEGSTSEQLDGLCPHARSDSAMLFQEHISSSKDGSLENLVNPNHLPNSLKENVVSVISEMSFPVGLECQNDGKSVGFATSIENCVGNEDPGSSLLAVKVNAAAERNGDPFLAGDKLLLESEHSDCFVEKHVISYEQSNLICNEDSGLKCVDSTLSHADKILRDRFSDAELERGDTSIATNDREIPAMNEITYSDVFVPDTLDAAKDNIAHSALKSYNRSPCSMKNEHVAAIPMLGTSTSCSSEHILKGMPKVLVNETNQCTSRCTNPMPEEVFYPVKCTPDDVLSKGLLKESHPEVGSSSGSSHSCSEKIDLDLAGQELARSMMTFLLPRALPLLKKTYKKRKVRTQNQENKRDPCSTRAESAEQNAESDHLTDITCQGKLPDGALGRGSEENMKEKVVVPPSLPGADSQCEATKLEPPVSCYMTSEPFAVRGSSEHVKFVIPDSFEDDQSVYDVAMKGPLPFGYDNVAPSDERKQIFDNSKLPVNAEAGKESLYCYLQNDQCHRVVTMPDEYEKGEMTVSDSPLASICRDNYFSLEEESKDLCIYVNGNILHADPTSISTACIDDVPSLDPDCVMHTSCNKINGEGISNDEAGNQSLFRSDKIEKFEQEPLAPSPYTKNLGDSEIPKAIIIQSSSMPGSPDTKICSSLHELDNFDVHKLSSTVGTGDGNVRSQVGAVHISQVKLDGKAVVTGKANASSVQMPNAIHPSEGLSFASHKVGKLLSPHSSEKYKIPLSESIICRTFNGTNVPETYFASKTAQAAKNGDACPLRSTVNKSMSSVNEVKADEQPHNSNSVEIIPASEGSLFAAAPVVSQNQEVVNNVAEDLNPSKSIDPSLSCSRMNCLDAVNALCFSGKHCSSIPQFQDWRQDSSHKSRNFVMEVIACSDNNQLMNSTVNNDRNDLLYTQLYQERKLDGSSSKEAKSNKEVEGSMKLAGCFLHPIPVLSVLLISKEDDLQICVLCGLSEGNDRNLFIYMVPVQEQKGKCPSFLGYTSLLLPFLNEPSSGKIPFERSGLQFTPDGRFLVFLNSIKAPHCREQKFNCLCSNCKSDCYEENAVEVAHVKFGYVSSVAKLTTIESVSCVLVCEPNYLITAEESGRLHAWIMNPNWSGNLDEFMLPSFDDISPAILELKRIPKSNSLIIGHNGIGGLGLWDISKRVLLAKFSSPGNLIFQILPLGVFCWPNKSTIGTSLEVEEHIKKTILATNNWIYEASEDHSFLSSNEDLAVWILVSATSDFEIQYDQVKEPSTSPVGWWRLALLAKNIVVMGSVLDPRASAVGASSVYGIIGTCDGLVYMWELSTGKKLANLLSFKDGGVSCMAFDAESGALAVASGGRRLLVYVQPQRNCAMDE